MWESTFGPGNKEVKSGLEEESGYYKSLGRMKENKAKCKRRKLNRKLDRVLNCLSSLIVDKTKRNIICKDAQSLKDVHDLSLGEIVCTIINNFSKKSDIKILSDILETCDHFQEEVSSYGQLEWDRK